MAREQQVRLLAQTLAARGIGPREYSCWALRRAAVLAHALQLGHLGGALVGEQRGGGRRGLQHVSRLGFNSERNDHVGLIEHIPLCDEVVGGDDGR